MTATRAFCFAALCCFVLAACDREPIFDASSVPAYQKSLRDINARLSATDQRKLATALMTLAAGSGADYTAYAQANPDNIADFEFLNGVASPLVYLDRMRLQIEGKSAATVIGKVSNDLDFAIALAEAQTESVRKELKGLVIENARYYWDGRTQPAAQFSFYNGSRIQIAALYVSGVITAPGLKTPVTFVGVRYGFLQPVQPGTQEQVKIFLGSAGEWKAKQLDGIYDADLTLKIANIDDGSGKRLLATNIDALDAMRRTRDLLRGT
jgi:hypothetical protein